MAFSILSLFQIKYEIKGDKLLSNLSIKQVREIFSNWNQIEFLHLQSKLKKLKFLLLVNFIYFILSVQIEICQNFLK